ncbi:MAG: carboxypeptidase-like regulatory domain-containing protein [Chitinophagaceae bacterium]
MRKHIQINIPEPCPENWDEMKQVDKARQDHPVGRGRFCGSCQKQVIDFTSMSDEQLAAFFKKPTQSLSMDGSVCGRFLHYQLDRNIDIPKKRIPWVKYFFQFALPAFLVSSKAVAQGKVRMLTGTTVVISNPVIEKTENIIAAHIEKVLWGRVIDDNNEGIPYASVFIKGTTIGVAADNAGNFSLKYSGVEDSVVLISSCVGFQDIESIVSFNKNDGIIIISLLPINTLGEVVVVELTERKGRFVAGGVRVVEKINILDTVCSKIFPSKKSLGLYPNPVKRNTSLAIEMNKQETGTYLLQLSALNGQVLLRKEIWVEENCRIIKFNIPPVAAGAYLLRMINKQSGKNYSEKFMIE